MFPTRWSWVNLLLVGQKAILIWEHKMAIVALLWRTGSRISNAWVADAKAQAKLTDNATAMWVTVTCNWTLAIWTPFFGLKIENVGWGNECKNVPEKFVADIECRTNDG
jgi:hypothetical protein